MRGGKGPSTVKKAATLDQLKRDLGSSNMVELDRERLIRFGRERAKRGAGPVTLGIDVGTIKLVLTHAAAVHGLPVRADQVDLARVALFAATGYDAWALVEEQRALRSNSDDRIFPCNGRSVGTVFQHNPPNADIHEVPESGLSHYV